jgi:hypothetical protein
MPTLLDWQLDVKRRLEEGLPNTPVYLEGITENVDVVKDPSAFFKPSLILWFGQAYDMATYGGSNGMTDLCGTGGDSVVKQASFLVQNVAPSGLSALQLAQAVRDLLTGYQPVGLGELTEAGSGTVRDPYLVGIGDTRRFYLSVGWTGVIAVGRTSTSPNPPISAGNS